MGSSSSTCNNSQTSPYFFSKYGRLGKNDNPILCGKNDSDIDRTDCYSYQNKMWKEIPSLTSVRGAASMSLSPYPNSSILLTGGQNEFANTGEYLTENGWQNVSAPLPVNISYHCSVLVNSTTVLIIGGFQNVHYFSPETYLLNTENEKWIEGPSLKIGRGGHLTCAKIKEDDKSSAFIVIVANGAHRDDGHTSVEIISDLESKWHKGPELPSTLYIHKMVEDPSGGVFLIGKDFVSSSHNAKLLHLAHAKAEWVEIPPKFNYDGFVNAAFYVPDEITNCTQEN